MVGVVSSALLALMLLGPATVSAATPILTPGAITLSPVVKNGDYAAFQASMFNDPSLNTSTVSQLFLLDNGSDATFVSATPSQGTCNSTGPLYCALGQLKPGATATVTVVVTTKAAPETSQLFSAIFNTTGLGSGGGDNSHGDAWPVSATAVLTDSPEFGGRWVVDNLTVDNLQTIGPGNPHSTRAYAPKAGIYTTVQDVDCTISTDTICSGLSTGFGQVSKVNVNNGMDVSGTPMTTLLHFTIQTYKSEIPSGKNANNIYVIHTYDDGAGAGLQSETISTRCTFQPKSNPVPSNAPCITVTKLSNGFQVDVWTFHNGGLRLS